EVDNADEILLRDACLGTDGPALLAFFRKRTPSQDDQRHLQGLLRQLGSTAYPVRSHASKALIAAGPPALPLLRQALRNPDREVARRAELCIAEIERSPGSASPAAAARLLARRQPPEAVAVLLRYLPHADDETVADEVLAALVVL